MRLYFSTVAHPKMTERSQKNKATLSTKKPRSAPGPIVRVQQSRSDFRNMRRYFVTAAAALLHAHNETWCGSRLFCWQSGFIFCDLSVVLC
jgi:hypothetical protein